MKRMKFKRAKGNFCLIKTTTSIRCMPLHAKHGTKHFTYINLFSVSLEQLQQDIHSFYLHILHLRSPRHRKVREFA